jgi:hypothetical protein
MMAVDLAAVATVVLVVHVLGGHWEEGHGGREGSEGIRGGQMGVDMSLDFGEG